MDTERYSFEVTWFDTIAEITRRYLLVYFVHHSSDNEVEMIDLKSKKTFLKRCPYPSVKFSDLFIGAKLTIYSRQLEVVSYADPFTERTLGAKQSRTLAVVTHEGQTHLGNVIDNIVSSGLTLKNIKMINLNATEASAIAGNGRSEVGELLTGDVVALELVGENAAEKWQNIVSNLPGNKSNYYGSNENEDAPKQLDLIFGSRPIGSRTATFDNCTLCIIKPHAVKELKAGKIIHEIQSTGFEISAIQSFQLSRVAASEFLEVYKGVLPEFREYVDDLCSGVCIAMEIRAENAVEVFRKFAGPHEVEIAQHIRPNTLRSRFGSDKVKNAVHCTDLSEDGVLECQYFFETLQTTL